MNCIIQCLSNTEPLRNLFLSGMFKSDLNRDNVLGSGGRIAIQYYLLQQQLWSGENKPPFSPKLLKDQLGRMNQSFSGYQQQDAQEMMNFLIDYLHEDLNRIKKKPYIEDTESEGRPDADVAAEAWANYKRRNDSHLDDIFQGQEKSQLTCPECGFISVKFDNFSVLSLPVPQKTRLFEIIFLDGDPTHPAVRYGVRVAKIGQFSAIHAALSSVTKVPVGKMAVYAVLDCEALITTAATRIEKLPDEATLVAFIKQDKVQLRRVLQFTQVQTVGTECKVCGKSETAIEGKLKACSQCKCAHYCSTACQVLDWKSKGHKKECKKQEPVLYGTPFWIAVNDEGKKHTTAAALKKRLNETAKRIGQPKAQSMTFKRLSASGKVIAGVKPYSASSTELIKSGSVHCLAITYTLNANITQPESPIVPHASLKQTDEDVAAENQQPTLNHCFEKYQRAEILEESEMWYCSKCKKHQQAEKQLSVWKAPEILVLHLKRFSFRNILWKDKLDFMIEYPLEGLDVSPYVTAGSNDGCIYDLYAVAHHHGMIWGGHYTSHAKSPTDGKWRKFDDSIVSMATAERAGSSKDAYVLFYRRRQGPAMPATIGPVMNPAAVAATAAAAIAVAAATAGNSVSGGAAYTAPPNDDDDTDEFHDAVDDASHLDVDEMD